MSSTRTRTVATGIAAAGALAGLGLAAGSALRRRRPRALGEPLAMLPPVELGPVRTRDDVRLEVRAAGPQDAPTIVFVHGFSLDMTTWHHQWIGLRDYRCVLYDHRGHGRSAPASDLSVAAMGFDLGAILDAVGDGRPVLLVAHSMGALAVLSAADTGVLGDRVAGVVLMGASSSDLFLGAMGSITNALRPRLGSVVRATRRVDRLRRAVLASPADVARAFTRLTQFGQDATPELVEHVVSLAARASSEVWTDGLAHVMEADLRHAVAKLTVPTLVVVGQEDRVTPPSAAVELVGALPDGRLAVIPGAGHLTMLECPQDVNDLLRGFATEVLPASSAPEVEGGNA